MTISQICENLNISQDTLRYYERIGLIPKIEKNSGGFREYTEVDCQRISMIKSLRTAGMPIDALAKYIAMARSDDGMVDARKKMLFELRDQLKARIDELQATLIFLNENIADYETKVASNERALFSQK